MSIESATDVDNDLDRRIRENQRRLTADLAPHYDFVVCGAGSSGSVVARRLAEDPAASVLLVEAGGSDDVPGVTEVSLWQTNLGSETDWAFPAESNHHLNGRSLLLSMGKVLGGGSSINAMTWARGHKADWDFFADASGCSAWGYESVLDIYRHIEDWQGTPDDRRGSGGPVHVEPKRDPHPVGPAVLEAARSVGVVTFDNPNGKMMEGRGGAAIMDLRTRGNKRASVFKSYTYPYMDRPNLTVLTHACVRRVIIQHQRAIGVEVRYEDELRQFLAGTEVVLSMGAIHTPKTLMLSGVGDQHQLRPWGIPVEQHLPGVGRNFHDHVAISCLWQRSDGGPAHHTGDTVLFWPSEAGGEEPDLFACQGALTIGSPESVARFGLPDAGWGFFGGPTHPQSRGRVQLISPDPDCAVKVVHNALSDSDDLRLIVRCVEQLREIGNSAPLRPHTKREVMPGDLAGDDLLTYLRDGALSYWHYVGSAKMGRDAFSVVDGTLKVYGVENLRVADASVMPRITASNTMAPCVVIGERAAQEIKSEHRLANCAGLGDRA
ncbi:choline dehydrogenase [Mycobacterium montefiorense]|uniref:Choline dehydrogenase n=1 Tax=Mycobacterium montefiorense TaxID=154654 RepID=A0AA37PL62_9MYCO|nr:choline dehydrogenase [Mycobacterium montefiorense]GKU32864.1 choline dehydrogenase [Mycobacterium montefiorense]GKU42541.1 choline dehydrogenase [Mycobacterium montefiorense]GKU48302.1 choline dehydrogenase [Mycobacterium montefiorense]GKU50803.1 choline dehydrogenase [Mycobacterium montefiorense]